MGKWERTSCGVAYRKHQHEHNLPGSAGPPELEGLDSTNRPTFQVFTNPCRFSKTRNNRLVNGRPMSIQRRVQCMRA